MKRALISALIFLCIVLATVLCKESQDKNFKKHGKENILTSVSKMLPTTYFYKSLFHGSDPQPDPDPDPEPDPEEGIHLYIVPHSHTDAGWIETIDWYYEKKVKYIFDNILAELYEDSEMTFVWADTNFLHQWYESQDSETQKSFNKIVERGQIEFVGGGWVQNDESLSDLKSIINQMNFGLQYLDEKFGAKPKVGWQIDPFGYNHFMPSVFQELGYDYLVLNRVGDIRKEEFKANASMDFWLESADMSEEKSKILTHILPRHYEPKDFDDLISSIPKENREESEKIAFVKKIYEKYIKEQVKGFPTNQYMLLMGKDFGFNKKNGSLKKIKYMGELLRNYSSEAVGVQINANFSLPSTYFAAVKKSKKLVTRDLDFLNYDERIVYLHPNEDERIFDYWVGYYSTRPHLK